MKQALFFLLLFSSGLASAYSKVKAVVQFPDNEEKTYAFMPTKDGPMTKIETKSDYGCLLAGKFVEDKTDLLGVGVICFNLKYKLEPSIESFISCGSVGVFIISTPESKKNKKFKATKITMSCE